ncbi:MAG: hypothetical protein H6Q15_480 [Bacteroidetes bacterium]|nr:hypothetical protein [Bacteroidota bacterium]
MNIIKIKDFSEYPGLRSCNISEKSGEEFYHEKFNSEFKLSVENKEKIQIDLDGTAGYSPSFLDEAFGNLVYDFSLDIVKKYIEIKSNEEPHLIKFIENEVYELWETKRKKNTPIKVTKDHRPWWRYINGEFIMQSIGVNVI